MTEKLWVFFFLGGGALGVLGRKKPLFWVCIGPFPHPSPWFLWCSWFCFTCGSSCSCLPAGLTLSVSCCVFLLLRLPCPTWPLLLHPSISWEYPERHCGSSFACTSNTRWHHSPEADLHWRLHHSFNKQSTEGENKKRKPGHTDTFILNTKR